jgi:hypothetical protein
MIHLNNEINMIAFIMIKVRKLRTNYTIKSHNNLRVFLIILLITRNLIKNTINKIKELKIILILTYSVVKTIVPIYCKNI